MEKASHFGHTMDILDGTGSVLVWFKIAGVLLIGWAYMWYVGRTSPLIKP